MVEYEKCRIGSRILYFYKVRYSCNLLNNNITSRKKTIFVLDHM